jgi:hypothetical protein
MREIVEAVNGRRCNKRGDRAALALAHSIAVVLTRAYL